MYDSPIAWCPIARAYVELDQLRGECEALQHCAAAECPLAHYFRPPEATVPERQAPAATP